MLRTLVAEIRAHVLPFGLAYLAAAELGHYLSFAAPEPCAVFWPASGLFLAVLVQSPLGRWPALLGAAVVASMTSHVVFHHEGVFLSAGLCAANTLEACLGAWLLSRYAGTPFSLTPIHHVLALAGLSAVLSTMAGATVAAATTVAATGSGSFASTWLAWWLASAGGVLVMASLVFAWAEDARSDALSVVRLVEAVLILLGLLLATEGVYGEWLYAPLRVPIFILPFLLWAAIRFGPRGASAAVLLVAVIAAWHTSHGRGPYAPLASPPFQQMLRAQGSLAVISLSIMLLAAGVAERRAAEQARLALIANLQTALTEIKTLRGMIPICAWCKSIRDDAGYWQQLEKYLYEHTDAHFSHGICPKCYEKQEHSIDSGESEPS
jgi:integral membrane sensor domain MASE1